MCRPAPPPLQAADGGGGAAEPVAAAPPAARASLGQPAAPAAGQRASLDSTAGKQHNGVASDSPTLQSDVSIAVAQVCPDLAAAASSGPAVIVTPHESERLQASRHHAVLCKAADCSAATPCGVCGALPCSLHVCRAAISGGSTGSTTPSSQPSCAPCLQALRALNVLNRPSERFSTITRWVQQHAMLPWQAGSCHR